MSVKMFADECQHSAEISQSINLFNTVISKLHMCFFILLLFILSVISINSERKQFKLIIIIIMTRSDQP